MALAEGVVEAISVKEMPEPDKFDNTHRFSFKLDSMDKWFSVGSVKGAAAYVNKNLKALNKGDMIEFAYDINGDFFNVRKPSVQRTKEAAPQVASTSSGISGTGSPNPAAVGQVLNILLDSGLTLKGIGTMSDQELVTAIQAAQKAKDRIASLWNVSEVEADAVAEAKTDPEMDDIPF